MDSHNNKGCYQSTAIKTTCPTLLFLQPTLCNILAVYWGVFCQVSWLDKIAKSLFYFTFFFFSYLDLLHKKGVWESITWQCCMSQSHVIISHNKYGKIVHRLYSSCISSVQNQIGTLLSSPCQLRLEVVLRHLSLSPYTCWISTSTYINIL